MKKTAALIEKLNPEQVRQIFEVLNHPGDAREVMEKLPTDTLAAFQEIIEAALEEKRSA